MGVVLAWRGSKPVRKWDTAEVGHSHQAADVLDDLAGLGLTALGLIVLGLIASGLPLSDLLVSDLPALDFVALELASVLGGLKL